MSKTKKKSRYIDWNDPMNLIPLHVAVKEFPFDGPTLGLMTGLSVGQVYYRLKRYGISLRDLRKGEYGHGADVFNEYVISNVKVKIHVPKMTDTWAELECERNGWNQDAKTTKKQKTA